MYILNLRNPTFLHQYGLYDAIGWLVCMSKEDQQSLSKSYSKGTCLLLFSPEHSVFPSVVKKSKNENIQDYNFASDFVWVRNLISGTKGET
jgi:hypothetical protein